jgi:hypothetical protein
MGVGGTALRLIGLHLLQAIPLVHTRRRSALAEVDAGGRLVRLGLATTDADILAQLPEGPALVVVDAPLAVPDEEGSRDVERVLAWCDVPAFPTAARRLRAVYGGMRGVGLAPALRAAGREVTETLPDLVLRQLAWERSRPPGALDLAGYRTYWLGVRAPAYRAKGAGRARPEAMAPARELLAGALDLGGWGLVSGPDEWQALDDAARLDALACAAVAWRSRHGAPGSTTVLGTPERGALMLPVDACLGERIVRNLARLRDEGAVEI